MSSTWHTYTNSDSYNLPPIQDPETGDNTLDDNFNGQPAWSRIHPIEKRIEYTYEVPKLIPPKYDKYLPLITKKNRI